MKEINKNHDDLVVAIDLMCASGTFNLTALSRMYFYLYTLDSNHFVEAYYDRTRPVVNPPDGYLHNIIRGKSGTQWFIRINNADLQNLENGQLRVRCEYSIADDHFDGGFFDGTEIVAMDAKIMDDGQIINRITTHNCC
jgi:hypothetical protein